MSHVPGALMLCLSIASMARAADDRSGLGFSAGLISGLGLTYRHHGEGGYGYSIGGLAYGDSDDIGANIGFQLLRTLDQGKKTRFYALAGTGVFYRGDHFDDGFGQPEEWDHEYDLNFGVGIGMEFTFLENMALAIEVPLTLRLQYDQPERFGGLYPYPAASLVYYF